ncbi:DUF4118 domain-containing protein [Streptomyces sp. MMG1121]|uniref:DUF4118 domain-containing protein n=1 Tax=Streptomyces sp. MMG1121 TaxID=1415544 RepID=UPI000A4F66F7|nr:DUF4118 domain-containing protein [Streptomyces sp. MMG1121]
MGAWFDFFLTRPYQTFDITASADNETAVLLLAVGVIVSQLASMVRWLGVMTVTAAALLARIHRTADLVQSANSADTVVDHVRGELTDLLGLRACRFEYGSLMGRPPRLERDGSVTVGRRTSTPDADWPEGEIELRTYGDGRFLLTPRTRRRTPAPGPYGRGDAGRPDGGRAGHVRTGPRVVRPSTTDSLTRS